MLKKYKMPNGRTYQFEESEAPANAKLVGEKKADKANKSKSASNKAKKAAVK